MYGVTITITECFVDCSGSKDDSEQHVATVGKDHANRSQHCGESIGQDDITDREKSHGEGKLVDLLLCHDSSGKTFSDTIDSQEEDQETLAPEQIRSNATTEVVSAIQIQQQVGVGVTKENYY